MRIPTLATVAREAGLPDDVVELARQRFHLVAASTTSRTVFRVGLAEIADSAADPCDVGRSHVLAVAMSAAGLNVLRPATELPQRRSRYTVSASPMAEPLAATGWRPEEPALLGTAMARWAHFTSGLLQPLDIPGYSGARIDDASVSADPGLRAAAQWCAHQREAAAAHYPWHQLAHTGGCIHGDPNLGNLVRLPSTPTPLFIDLDSVKYGPRFYDLAVMQLYTARFAANYPWTAILAGYERAAGPVHTEVLWGLRQWKELSSATQLLTRWSQPGIAAEFWRRTTLDDSAPWTNVTHTLVQAG